MSRALVFLLALQLTVPGMACGANDFPCPPSGQPIVVTIEPFNSELTYHFNYSEADMMLLSGDNVMRASSNVHLRGLATALYGSKMEFSYYVQKMDAGWCLAPVSVTVQLGFHDVRIYVDSKYQSKSCQRHAVLIHEAKHIGIFYEEMNAGIPQVYSELNQAIADAGFPIFTTDLDDGRKYISDYVSYYTKQGFYRIDQRIVQRNTALDNPQEYSSIAAMCLNW
ncbi:MAG: hypothetical protein WCK65_07605 [Rhodospirillaceae bacterium]